MTASGRYFTDKEPFRIGVSYWPREAGIAMWKHFDVDEVHEDFAMLSELGVNLARITLLWEDFQPEPEALRCAALAHLLELCDAAASEGVRLELLLFAGQAGHPERFPRWLRDETPNENVEGGDEHCRLVNPFSNPLARTAATTLVRGIARTVGGHPAVWAYNLGDRPDRLAPQCCRVAANAWFETLRQEIHAIDKKHPVTCSLGHRNLSTNATLRVDEVFSVLDHSTIVGDAGSSQGVSSADEGIFSCALTAALTGKRCLLQADWHRTETTRNASVASNEFEATLTRSLLEGLHRIGALGTVLGTFSDLPSELNAGILAGDGRGRAQAAVVQEFTSVKRYVEPSPVRSLQLGVTASEYYEQPEAHMRRLYGEFLAG